MSFTLSRPHEAKGKETDGDWTPLGTVYLNPTNPVKKGVVLEQKKIT